MPGMIIVIGFETLNQVNVFTEHGLTCIIQDEEHADKLGYQIHVKASRNMCNKTYSPHAFS